MTRKELSYLEQLLNLAEGMTLQLPSGESIAVSREMQQILCTALRNYRTAPAPVLR